MTENIRNLFSKYDDDDGKGGSPQTDFSWFSSSQREYLLDFRFFLLSLTIFIFSLYRSLSD